MYSHICLKDGDLVVDVVVSTQMCWVCKFILKNLDGRLIFGDAILSNSTDLSSGTKMRKMDGSVLPEGNVHLRDVLESIDVSEGA